MLGDPSWGARCGVGTWVVGSGVGWKPPAWKSRCVVESLSMGARGGHVSSSSSCLRDPPPPLPNFGVPEHRDRGWGWEGQAHLYFW